MEPTLKTAIERSDIAAVAARNHAHTQINAVLAADPLARERCGESAVARWVRYTASAHLFATPLQFACFTANIRVIEALIEGGCNVNNAGTIQAPRCGSRRLQVQATPLHIACKRNSIDVVKILLQHGCACTCVA